MSDAELVDTIGAIYDAAVEPARWQDALAHVARFTGAESGVLGLSDAYSETAEVFVRHNVPDEFIARWVSEFGQEDVWASATIHLVEGDVVTGASLVPPETLRDRPAYRDLMVPAGGQDVLAAIVAKNRLRTGWVNVYPGVGRGLFDAAAIERMVPLVPHLQRSARIHARFAEFEHRWSAGSAALDALGVGIVVCDERGRVVYANRMAAELLEAGDGVSLRDDRLAAPGGNEAMRIRELLEGSAATAARRGPRGGGAVALPRRSGGRPLTAVVAPLSPGSRDFPVSDPSRPASLVMISSPERSLDVPEDLLGELFGLTPAEARLAHALAQGESVEDYAARAGIGVGTTRWHLKQVFSKTDTRRQGELISLVLRSLVPLV